MADSVLSVLDSSGTAQNIDTRTESANSHMRQVITIGDPLVNAAVAEVASVDPGSSSTLYGQVVRLAGSASVVTATGSTLRVLLDSATGLPAGINTLGSVAVFFNPSVPQVSVSGITNSISVHLISTGGTIVTKFAPETGLPAGVNTLGSIAVFFNPSVPGVSISGQATGNTLRVFLDAASGLPAGANILGFSNISSTAVIGAAGGSVAGTASGVSASGNTIVSPEASRNIKVYAFSITTTAQVGLATRFTQGSAASPTELWRVALQAPTAPGISGANLAVTPPGYLFAAGVGNTLSLVLDSASLVHYSVAYFKESV